ncbi:site-specific DNA-methyltransferase [Winogradskyella pacifica]|uniref:site-specific DNA-methyltransferase n=1 Tax=Winogradskyella pacifica TaxID=664642 RepID=UPI0015CEDB53|nr:site-specific DNA-methyltransferase [Winogradskyella pacifica]
MPTLHWIGKEKVVSHHQDVPYKILNHTYGFTEKGEQKTETKSGNKIIKGDNLLALKALLPEYEGKIKCIYIDPPYNTGKESWVYNDNVNHPKIKKWLGEVVGKDGEDLTRHDKWLCMMYPRLKLLHKLLAEDGVIFVSIDENEVHNLRLMLNDIFGSNNFIEQLVWNKRVPKNDKGIGNIHEYVLLYSKENLKSHRFTQLKEGLDSVFDLVSKHKRKKTKILEVKSDLQKLFKKNGYDRGITLYNNLDANYDLFGKINLSWPNGQTNGPRFDIFHPITKKPCNVPDRGWRWKKETFDSYLDYDNVEKLADGSYKCGKIWFAKDENTQPSSIKYLYEVKDFLLRSIISLKSSGSIDLEAIFEKGKFDYPKPVNLLELLLNSFDDKDALILDSFAGSGTTAHAVLNLNKADEGSRKFILIEMEDYAEEVTSERIKRVINGYGKDKKEVEGTGGAFDFYELGKPIFKDNENLNEEVGEDKIRNYIYYTETKQPLTRQQSKEGKYLLDNYQDTGYYFYYEKDSLTTLDNNSLGIISELQEQYIIYADICLLDEAYMLNKNIIFKKIPRDIKRF